MAFSAGLMYVKLVVGNTFRSLLYIRAALICIFEEPGIGGVAWPRMQERLFVASRYLRRDVIQHSYCENANQQQPVAVYSREGRKA
jgi:hypothetical protein